MTDKESQADEEILIYAMTLINKVRSKLHHNFVERKSVLWLEHLIPVKESLYKLEILVSILPVQSQ